MNENRSYGVRVESAKYGVGFGSALAIAISYTANHSILWAIIHGILGWLYVIYFALFQAEPWPPMCNRYSITNQAAIAALFRVGNLPPMPGVVLDYPAPVVRNSDGEREMMMVR